MAGPPARLLPHSMVCIFRSDEFRGGSSGTVMSCRLGMLTTMRRWAVCGAEDFRLAIFSIVGLLGLRSIPFILGGKSQHLTCTITIQQVQLGIFPSVVPSVQYPRAEGEVAGACLALPHVVKAECRPHPPGEVTTHKINEGIVDDDACLRSLGKATQRRQETVKM